MTSEGKQDVWRAALSLESHYVLQVQLTPWGQNGSRSASLMWVSEWFLLHHNPKIPVWTLTSARSTPCLSRLPALCPSPRTISILLCYLWRRLSLPLVHCHCLSLGTRLGIPPPPPQTPLMRQSPPPTRKPETPNTLCPSLPCSYGEHKGPRCRPPNPLAPRFETEAVTRRFRNHTEPVCEGGGRGATTSSVQLWRPEFGLSDVGRHDGVSCQAGGSAQDLSGLSGFTPDS